MQQGQKTIQEKGASPMRLFEEKATRSYGPFHSQATFNALTAQQRGEILPAGGMKLNDKSATQFSARGGDMSQDVKSMSRNYAQYRSQQPSFDRMMERHSPVLHMQFDEMASNALNNTYKFGFKKQGQI